MRLKRKLYFYVRRVPGEHHISAILLPQWLRRLFLQLDSLKSRLQTTKTRVTVPGLAAMVYREEGIIGFYRGLWIPLITISFVRASFLLTCSLNPYWPGFKGAASFTIYSRTKEHCRNHNYLNRNSIIDVALVGGLSGAMSGALISFGSTRMWLLALKGDFSVWWWP